MASTRRKARQQIVAEGAQASGKIAGVLQSDGFETKIGVGNFGRGLFGTGKFGGQMGNYIGQKARANT
jgi:hypothetical protein